MLVNSLKPRIQSRRIVKVDWHVFSTGRGNKKTTDPTFYMDDGSYLTFNVAETEVGEYGIEVNWHRPGMDVKAKKSC